MKVARALLLVLLTLTALMGWLWLMEITGGAEMDIP